MSEGRAWAALSVRELGRASSEIAQGLERDDALLTTREHIKTALEAAKKAVDQLTRSVIHLEAEEEAAERSPQQHGENNG